MIRLAGILLVWGGCAFWGIREGQRLRRRVHALEDMGWALEVLERELALNRTAVPELLERLAQRKTVAAEVFSCCSSELKRGSGFADAWAAALEQSELGWEERALLAALSQVLGRYDARGQEQVLSHLRQEVEQRCVRQREQACALGRVYGALGITAGGFITLTLL